MTDDGGIMDPRWDKVTVDGEWEPQVPDAMECSHHWTSIHQPDLPMYWIEQCSMCHRFNAERMLNELNIAGWFKKEIVGGHSVVVKLPPINL